MKEATVDVKLSKDNSLRKTHVTPMEALLLAAEHNRNVGDVPVIVLKETIRETTKLELVLEADPHRPGAKRDGHKEVPDKRSLDEELDRLRNRYGRAKVKAILSEVKELPTEDFDAAIKRGMNITLPSSELSQTKLV